MSETALVTGAFGSVGSATVRRFATDSWQVIATAHREADEALARGVTAFAIGAQADVVGEILLTVAARPR